MKKRIIGIVSILGLAFVLGSCDSKSESNKEANEPEKIENKEEPVVVTPTVTKLDSPVLVLNEKKVTWDNVDNATSYVVNINGTDLDSQTSSLYTLTTETAGNYVIKVKALSENELYSESDYSQSVTITIEEEVITPLINTTLWVIGDSTVCSFTDDYYLPRYGYGTQLKEYLSSSVTINNLALSGRSSRSFLTESNYQTLKNNIKSGDYLMIGFGHNDEKDDDAARYAAPTLDSKDTEKNSSGDYNFQYILNKYYLEMAKDKGATPILCTPIVRLNSSNNYDGSSGHITSKGNYVSCIKDLAEDTNTTVIDLTTLTKAKYKAIGYDEAKLYHAVTKCKEENGVIVPNYGSIDTTHINKYGAKEVAYLLIKELKETSSPLAKYVNKTLTEPTKDVDYVDAINTNKEPSVYEAVDWSKYSNSSFTTITKGNITYNSENVGYGWVGTVFGSNGGTTKKWYANEISAGTFKVGQSKTENNNTAAGKIFDTEEGYGFIFSQIDANYNFTVTATLKVIETANTNQAGFGIMLRDDCYLPANDKTILSNNVVAGLMCQTTSSMVVNWSRETDVLKPTTNTLTGLYAKDDTAEIKLTRTGQVVLCEVTYKNNKYSTTYTDFDFTAIDSNYMYVGVCATRGTIVTTSNLSLTITGVSQGA